MPDIATSFDEPPSKDGGAVSELLFEDLIPEDDDQPPPSPFELMWREAQNSVDSSTWNPNSDSWTTTDTEIPDWPQGEPDGSAIDPQQQSQASPERDLQAPESREIATETSDAPLESDGTAEAPLQADESGKGAVADDGAASATPTPPPENSAAQTPPAPLPPSGEQTFDDLVPKGPWRSQWPFAGSLLHPDPNGLLQGIFPAVHNAASPLGGPLFGIGHNGGPPLEDTPAWRMFKARLLRGTALGALLDAVSPTALNRGELEYLASIFTSPYGQLKGKLPQGFQAHHLNQDAAFGEVIPRDDGVSVGMQGNAITDPGTTHYVFHQSLEQFWNRYRDGGDRYGKAPTVGMYAEALQRGLQESGYSSDEASYLSSQAAADRAKYGVKELDSVPRIPKRLNQTRPAR